MRRTAADAFVVHDIEITRRGLWMSLEPKC
jgi:hypothetical protein